MAKLIFETLEGGGVRLAAPDGSFAVLIGAEKPAAATVVEADPVLAPNDGARTLHAKRKQRALPGRKDPDAFSEPDPGSNPGKILAVIRKGPPRSSGELIELLKMTPPTIYTATSSFKKAGIVKLVDTERGRGWAPV